MSEVEDELSLVVDAPSSLLLQEIMVRLKRNIKIMCKIFFIFSSIPKVKYYGLELGEPNLYHYLGDFTRSVDFTWRVSDCEELVGVTHREWCD